MKSLLGPRMGSLIEGYLSAECSPITVKIKKINFAVLVVDERVLILLHNAFAF